MALAVNRMGQFPGQPGLHVFIIGVSDYTNLPAPGGADHAYSFGFRKLSAAATSAYRIFEWFESRQPGELPLPLLTCTVLLSPTALEKPKFNNPAYPAASFAPATFAGVQQCATEWRALASLDPANMVLFYFAGHGVRRTGRDVALLLQDFGAAGPMLRHAVSVANLLDGMAPGDDIPGLPNQAKIARNQVYLIDSCRNMPNQFKSLTPAAPSVVWDPVPTTVDDRKTPLFFATVDGTAAFEIVNDQTLFSKAFLAAVQRAAESTNVYDSNAPWLGTTHALEDGLRYEFELLQLPGRTFLEHMAPKITLYLLPKPPLVEVSLECVPPEHAAFINSFSAAVTGGVPLAGVPCPIVPHPHTLRCPAGLYSVTATATNAGALQSVTQPFMAFPLKLNTWRLQW